MAPGEIRMDVREAEIRIDTSREGYLDRALELRPILAAAGDEIERGREVTPEIVRAMIERGIFKMLLPRSLGGAELDPLTYTAILESLAHHRGRGRLSVDRAVGLCYRQPACQLARLPCPGLRAGRQPAPLAERAA